MLTNDSIWSKLLIIVLQYRVGLVLIIQANSEVFYLLIDWCLRLLVGLLCLQLIMLHEHVLINYLAYFLLRHILQLIHLLLALRRATRVIEVDINVYVSMIYEYGILLLRIISRRLMSCYRIVHACVHQR